jgi:hypothetical protein
MFIGEGVRSIFTNSSYAGNFMPGSGCLDMELVARDHAEVLVILICFRCNALLLDSPKLIIFKEFRYDHHFTVKETLPSVEEECLRKQTLST